jgi:hypothetical protein
MKKSRFTEEQDRVRPSPRRTIVRGCGTSRRSSAAISYAWWKKWTRTRPIEHEALYGRIHRLAPWVS